jgi:plasmid stabilization system protein ParE
MNFSFLEPAKAELEEVIAWYDQQRSGLGDEFAEEVQNTIQRILNHPRAWTSLSRNTRRCRTNRFPYGIVYAIKEDEILIVALMHLHRRPDYWKDRLSEPEE